MQYTYFNSVSPKTLRIKGIYGHPPFFDVITGKALYFYWSFFPGPAFPDFNAQMTFQYNLADLANGMTAAEIADIYGYDNDPTSDTYLTWVRLNGDLDPVGQTIVIYNQKRFYSAYAIGNDSIQPGVPTMSEWSILLLIAAMGSTMIYVRRRNHTSPPPNIS
jgi:hypothetical protein